MRLWHLTLVICALTISALLAAAAAELVRAELNDCERVRLVRERSAHAFFRLREGVVHYRLEGAADAPVILLIHGFSTALFVWDAWIPSLASLGWRVLAFDNFGRGYSDRPWGRYDPDRTDNLICELLEVLDIRAQVNIVGYSMGGAIASLFTVRRPHQVRTITLIAPSGLTRTPSFVGTVIQMPIFGEVITSLVGPHYFFRSKQIEAKEALADSFDFLWKYQQQLRYRGFARALLSTTRHYPLTGLSHTYALLSGCEIPTLAIWGERDNIVPFSFAHILRRLIPRAEIVSFPDQTHAITYASPGLALAQVERFCRRHRERPFLRF